MARALLSRAKLAFSLQQVERTCEHPVKMLCRAVEGKDALDQKPAFVFFNGGLLCCLQERLSFFEKRLRVAIPASGNFQQYVF